MSRECETLTELHAGELVPKDHPRILLRGRLDTLAAEILLLMTEGPDGLREDLADALRLVHAILAAEALEKPLGPWTLGGMAAETLRETSHHPERYGFPGHRPPAPEHGRTAAALNRLRAISRETEIAAVTAFRREDGSFSHEDCILALNRLSSFFYVLQLRAAQSALEAKR